MSVSWKRVWCSLVLMGSLACAPWPRAWGQLLEPAAQSAAPNPLSDPTMNPGKTLLFDLEGRFAKDVLEKGGAGFAEWFAEDGVALGNGAAPLIGRVAIAKSANWSPKVYQLTWTPTDAVMGPSGDMGYTWGHFEGHSKDANGNPVTTTGRYMTIWRKGSRMANGKWFWTPARTSPPRRATAASCRGQVRAVVSSTEAVLIPGQAQTASTRGTRKSR